MPIAITTVYHANLVLAAVFPMCAMRVLGIETSCDETGVAVYDSERGLLAEALHSQIAIHNEYGGVVPELASRDHVRKLLPMVEEVLTKSHSTRADIHGIAYTAGPGLWRIASRTRERLRLESGLLIGASP